MELDRQAIERRDFPVARRGYDPASVDAHLRALASEIEELRRQAAGGGRESFASVAGAQVQGILEAAQASSESIVRDASELATRTREEADADAHATREQAIATARERVAAVTQATEGLLQCVGSIDGEARTLVESLRGGASRLVGDLEALSAEMAGLYDAAAGRAGAGEGGAGEPAAQVTAAHVSDPQAPAPAPAPARAPAPPPEPPSAEGAAHVSAAQVPGSGAAISEPPSAEAAAHVSAALVPGSLTAIPESPTGESPEQGPPASPDGENGAGASNDLDGARLVALNMALNGDSREATGRYLAENFQLPDTEKLLDEVYAAIEA